MSGTKVRRSATTLLEVVLVAGMMLTAVLGVVRPLIGPNGLGIGTGPMFGSYPSVEATVDLAKVRVQTSPELPTVMGQGEIAPGDALELTIPQTTNVGVHDPDLRQFVGLIGSEILAALLTVAVLSLLLLIVRTLRRGDPFVAQNARRLYTIAALVGLGGEAVVVLRAWGEADVLGHPSVAPYVVQSTEISLVPLAVGLPIAVAAEVFRQGAALREEVEGLV
jgi:hypothetical protein